MREALNDALSGFAAGAPLRACAETLFGVLGYRSTRTGEVGSVREFLERFDARGDPLTEKQRALFDSWRTVDIVFQVTGEEIAEQARLFDGKGFEPGVIESFLFLAVDMEGDDYNRTHLADTTRAVNRLFGMPVVILFRHGATLSLAVVHRRVHKRDTNRDVLEKVTLVKGIRTDRTPHRAHTDILAELALPSLVAAAGVRSFDDLHAAWERTLDVEELNRRFYRELLRWFERAVEECRFPDDGAGDGNAQRHVIRLITRLLFIWFLKEKGLAPDTVFEEDFARSALKEYAPDRTDYYRAVLQNLFFATLNTEIGKRAFRKPSATGRRDNPDHRDFSKYRYRTLLTDPDGFTATLQSVPFVNGGLFDCLDDFEGTRAGGRRIDAFTDNPAQGRDLYVPARLFFDANGLFPLFRGYKFTVEENTPLDREVALDPELLGLVFENLLAAYNPETRETARKATGSYYTPRHIVNYMVDETLAAALAENSHPTDGDGSYWHARLRYLLDYEDAGEFFDSGETQSIIRAIAELRVLDPAVGSGAFPMGMLHKLTLALRRLDPDNARWEALQKELAATRAGAAFDATDSEAREEELRAISRTFDAYRDSDFGRKLYLIQNGIFGVDIQPVACQIAKLRFFISLVIEQRTNADPNDNYGIRPLPNLETRFVAANTLIGLGDKQESVLGSDVIKTMEDELRRVRERYFNARTRETKRRLRKQDDALRAKLALKLEALGFGHDNAQAVATWDPYNQNAGAAWFDREWMFSVAEGFDAVIGNPPYIRGEKIADKGRLRTEYGDFYRGTADIYTYFFKKGVDLLKSNGLLCFITSNKFMRAGYGEPLRAFLKQDTPPLSILDFGRTGTFDATVRPSVLLAQKGCRPKTLHAATVRGKDGTTDPSLFMEKCGFPMPISALSDKGWSLVEPTLLRLRDKIEAAGTPLGEYLKENIYYGIKTGLNDAFVIDGDTRARLIDEDPNSADLIKPWLRGRDVRRWHTDWPGLHVIFTRRGTKIERYPAIKRHLARFRLDLEPKARRDAKRGRKPGSYKWFEIQDDIAYHEAFGKPKIVYPIIGREMRALLDRKNHLANDKCFIIPGGDEYLVALLNSKLLDLYFRLSMPCLDDPFDGGDMEFRGIFMERVPIVQAKPTTQRRLSRLAGKIQAAKEADPGANTTALEREIDETVYRLYGLEKKDVALIDRTLRS